MDTVGLSIVIPAYNEQNYLPNTLATIRRARELFENRFRLPSEVIVVNNNSTDDTKGTALRLGARVVDHDIRNIASVRNAGIRQAKYNLVVTVDADTDVPLEAYVKIWQTMQTGKYVGGGVRIGVDTPRRFIKCVAFVIDRIVFTFSRVSAGMFFFWREAAESVGGFPEDYLVAEDVAFAYRLKRYARVHGLRYKNLHSVKILTLDRKSDQKTTVFLAIFCAIKQLCGRSVDIGNLGYWYDPKR
jgi:glycosyltransferase involved in cell wall biosynthesis